MEPAAQLICEVLQKFARDNLSSRASTVTMYIRTDVLLIIRKENVTEQN